MNNCTYTTQGFLACPNINVKKLPTKQENLIEHFYNPAAPRNYLSASNVQLPTPPPPGGTTNKLSSISGTMVTVAALDKQKPDAAKPPVITVVDTTAKVVTPTLPVKK